jgi:hypothetical protein
MRLGALGGGMSIGGTPADFNQVDTSETVYISSLALLKALIHCRAGVPREVIFVGVAETVYIRDFLKIGQWKIFTIFKLRIRVAKISHCAIFRKSKIKVE